jgi:hypothetical protein
LIHETDQDLYPALRKHRDELGLEVSECASPEPHLLSWPILRPDEDVTLTGSSDLYWSRKNLAPGKSNDLDWAKADPSERLRRYTHLT